MNCSLLSVETTGGGNNATTFGGDDKRGVSVSSERAGLVCISNCMNEERDYWIIGAFRSMLADLNGRTWHNKVCNRFLIHADVAFSSTLLWIVVKLK